MPAFDEAVAASGVGELGIWAEGKIVDTAVMPAQGRYHFTCLKIPEFDGLIIGARNHVTAVWRDRHGIHIIFVTTQGSWPILAGNIPGVTQTIPLAIYEYSSTPGGDRMALSLCLVSILLSFVVLLASGAASRSLEPK